MPRNVRNSWVTLRVNERNPIETGPLGNNGTMNLDFKVREKGAVAKSITVRTYVGADNLHHLVVVDPSGSIVLYDHKTER